MPNKDRPLVDRHAPKNGVGWLLNDQEGKVCSFTNANPTAHAQWIVVERRSLRGGGQPVVRRMIRPTRSMHGKPCKCQASGSVALLSCDGWLCFPWCIVLFITATPLSDELPQSTWGFLLIHQKVGWLDSGELPSSYAIQVVCSRTLAICIRVSSGYSGFC